MAALQKMANDCKFTTLLDSMLITQFICGLRGEQVQRRLLLEKEEDVSKSKALEMAATAESTKLQQKEIREEKVQAVRHEHRSKSSKQSRPRTEVATTAGCRRCGGKHNANECPYREAVCRSCGKIGHLERMCESKEAPSKSRGHNRPRHNGNGRGRAINNVKGCINSVPPEYATLQLGRQTMRWEVDSGCPYTLVSWRLFQSLFPKMSLSPAKLHLWDYQGGGIKVLGAANVTVKYKEKELPDMMLTVNEKDTVPILGRNWFKAMGIALHGVHNVTKELRLDDVLKEYSEVFDSTLGCYRGPPVKFELIEGARPVALPPRNLPMALRLPVEKELPKLEPQGVLTRMEYSDWATPIVPVKKTEAEIRVCGDYKATVNKWIKPHAQKVPAIRDLLARVDGGAVFAKLDMTQAYQQLTVDEDTARMQAITTHKGTFAVNRLQFGISAAPGIFQSHMERLLGSFGGDNAVPG